MRISKEAAELAGKALIEQLYGFDAYEQCSPALQNRYATYGWKILSAASAALDEANCDG
jgi:hypothetical protein